MYEMTDTSIRESNKELDESTKEFISKADFANYFPHLFTRPELDWLIKNRHHNGFNVAVRKIGQRKILISVPDVLSWIDEQKG